MVGGSSPPPENAVVLSRSAVLAYAPGAETKPVPAKLLVLDRDAIGKYVPASVAKTLDTRLDPLLHQILAESGATVIVKVSAVALDQPIFDITSSVIARLNGRHDKIHYPQLLPVHILTIDRDAAIKNSKVYKSVQVQIDHLVNAGVAEMQEEKDQLAQEGTELQQKLPSLSPEDATAQEQAYDAKLQALQNEAAARDQAIKDSLPAVDRKVGFALEGALDKVMKRTGSQIVLMSDAITHMPPAHDATGEALRNLDESLPDVTLKPRSITPVAGH